MKRIMIWIVVLMFFISTTPAFAKYEKGKSPDPSKKAYEHANENARFKRTGDVKTEDAEKAVKRSEKEAQKAKKEAEKKAEKEKKAAEKKAQKERKEAEKEAKKQQKEAEKAAKEMNKKLGK